MNLARNIGGSVGISVVTTMLDRRTPDASERSRRASQPVQPGFAVDAAGRDAGHAGAWRQRGLCHPPGLCADCRARCSGRPPCWLISMFLVAWGRHPGHGSYGFPDEKVKPGGEWQYTKRDQRPCFASSPSSASTAAAAAPSPPNSPSIWAGSSGTNCLTEEIARLANVDRSAVKRCDERMDSRFYRLAKTFWRGSYERSSHLSNQTFDTDCMMAMMEQIS